MLGPPTRVTAAAPLHSPRPSPPPPPPRPSPRRVPLTRRPDLLAVGQQEHVDGRPVDAVERDAVAVHGAQQHALDDVHVHGDAVGHDHQYARARRTPQVVAERVRPHAHVRRADVVVARLLARLGVAPRRRALRLLLQQVVRRDARVEQHVAAAEARQSGARRGAAVQPWRPAAGSTGAPPDENVTPADADRDVAGPRQE